MLRPHWKYACINSALLILSADRNLNHYDVQIVINVNIVNISRGVILEEIVHIIPLSFEIDRALRPLEKLKANRVYLVYSMESISEKKAQASMRYLQVVKEKLELMGIDVVIR